MESTDCPLCGGPFFSNFVRRFQMTPTEHRATLRYSPWSHSFIEGRPFVDGNECRKCRWFFPLDGSAPEEPDPLVVANLALLRRA